MSWKADKLIVAGLTMAAAILTGLSSARAIAESHPQEVLDLEREFAALEREADATGRR